MLCIGSASKNANHEVTTNPVNSIHYDLKSPVEKPPMPFKSELK